LDIIAPETGSGDGHRLRPGARKLYRVVRHRILVHVRLGRVVGHTVGDLVDRETLRDGRRSPSPVDIAWLLLGVAVPALMGGRHRGEGRVERMLCQRAHRLLRVIMRQVDRLWMQLVYSRTVGMLLIVLDWLIAWVPLRLRLKWHVPIAALLLVMRVVLLVLLLLRCIFELLAILLWQVCLLARLVEVRFRVVVAVTEGDIRSVGGRGHDLLTGDNAPTRISKRVHLMHDHIFSLRFNLLSHICYLLL
jgi:hypothetical protein